MVSDGTLRARRRHGLRCVCLNWNTKGLYSESNWRCLAAAQLRIACRNYPAAQPGEGRPHRTSVARRHVSILRVIGAAAVLQQCRLIYTQPLSAQKPDSHKLHLRRLVKAGLLDKRHARRFALTSAWAELLGYCGNVALNALRISAALEREHALAQELLRRKKACLCYFFCMAARG